MIIAVAAVPSNNARRVISIGLITVSLGLLC
ncbi:hypothetical protein MES5069_510054 [Mesorhizobium escarrei]|uniref:Uncharacterized protein n=1 Tax=Mesorhizobium escarrei TaxID=666018 RepID=A0ABM9EAE0_9HYPH|nr:hypothetical protein MES5069_510054 [Mesorhizobium escarrei]